MICKFNSTEDICFEADLTFTQKRFTAITIQSNLQINTDFHGDKSDNTELPAKIT